MNLDPDQHIDIEEFAESLNPSGLNSLVRKLDNFNPDPQNDTELKAVFHDAVLALDATDYSKVSDKDSWIQNMESSLKRLSGKTYNLFQQKLGEESPKFKSLLNEHNKLIELRSSLLRNASYDDSIIYLDMETHLYTSEVEYEEKESGKVLEYDLDDFVFYDKVNGQKQYYLYMDKKTHGFINDKEIIKKWIDKDPEVLAKIERFKAPNEGMAGDIREYLEDQSDILIAKMYPQVVEKLDQVGLGGYIRQFSSLKSAQDLYKTEL